jgi:hypothetical protein
VAFQVNMLLMHAYLWSTRWKNRASYLQCFTYHWWTP